MAWSPLRNFFQISKYQNYLRTSQFLSVKGNSMVVMSPFSTTNQASCRLKRGMGNHKTLLSDNKSSFCHLKYSTGFRKTIVTDNVLIRPVTYSFMQTRLKSVKSRKHTQKQHTEKNHVDENEDDDDDAEVDEIFEDEAEGIPRNYKHKEGYMKNLRVDSLLSSGLNLSRNRTDEAFYSSLLRLNGEKLLKKSKQVAVGDYVDLILEKTSQDSARVQRVKLLKIDAEKTSKDKFVVTLRIWKSPFQIQIENEANKFDSTKS